MTTNNNLSIEQMREIVNSIPVWAREQNGKQIEYSPTHHNLHPHAQIKWVWNDGSITAICLIEQNQPEYWIDLNDLRTAIAKHDTTDHVTDIRNHVSPNTRVVDL
ncbi:hypothetical protein P7L54_13940 [Acinetobacter bereziniae]|uniref:hypothetical protein n=1 Tax=Acinetobacter bereziniae TaxID=106648 RepID=UPI001908A3E4|nr:hypothetical protein [Acinetobacter bereziniae]MDG3557048.1 hypothetical protein [Acinetobacter bereziniae]QQC81734.1 hypothetical protein I9192_06590 [Acinetobacter bereziniae]UUN94847.1 hypothetical protein I9189_006620 [Acinetobacter bereziniae]